MRGLLYTTFLFTSFLLLTRCSKESGKGVPPPYNTQKLAYGDSVFYLKNTDYTITPLSGKTGTYTSFPGNLRLDKTTGRITITTKGNDGESQTGLWYKIMYKSPDGQEVDSTLILLSGLTYVDKFYRLSQNDTIIYPVYNGNFTNAIPPGKYNLDQSNELAVNPANGQIDIKECIRRGFFGSQLHKGWEIAKIKYAINDNSRGAANEIDIVVYYYHSMTDVPSNVSAIMQAHQSMTVGLRTPPISSTIGEVDYGIPSNLSLSKPRPPCVIIVGN
jgi:hypothetical protein